MARRICLYNLPVELLTVILDYLDFRDILNLSEDHDFPVGVVRREHIDNDMAGGNILHMIARTGWTYIPQIRYFIQILDSWDIPHLHWNETPLGVAVKHGYYELCRFFIEAGAQVNPPRGISPLCLAVRTFKSVDLVSLLIQSGADVSWTDSKGLPIIFHAARCANTDSLDLLISSGADPKYFSERYGSLLHEARNPAVARLLIKHGADVNRVSLGRSSPLMNAVEHGRSEVVDVLLDAGAAVDYCEFGGLTALTTAIVYKRPDIVRKLISSGCEFNKTFEDELDPPLLLAAGSGNEDIVRILLENGVDVTARNSEDETVLFHVTKRSSLSLVQELVAAGADIEAKDKDGQTPLIKAIYAQDKKLVKLLLDAKADVSQLDRDGVHPTIALIAGTRSELRDIAQQFEDYGIDGLAEFKYFDHPDDDYSKMDTAMLQVLLDLGADVSEMNYKGIGILHYAVIRNNKDLVKFLLDAGADATYKDPGGNTPADWASVMGYGKIAELLRTAEADRKTI
jgi:uncharacterized protein